jgi:hypothetical protein
MNITLFQVITAAVLVLSVYALSTPPPSSLFAQQLTSNYSFVTSWGSRGSGFGQFSQPFDVATDSASNVYVTDFTALSNQVQKFSSDGTFMLSWGYLGTGGGGFANPASIAIDTNGVVYVTDW